MIVEIFDGFLQPGHGHEHILNYVVLFPELARGFCFCVFQEFNARRQGPAQQPSEQRMIAEGDDFLHGPEITAGMAMEVVPQRDVFHPRLTRCQHGFHVLVEPGLEPATDGVDRPIAGRRIGQCPGHDHGGITAVDQGLDELIAGGVAAFPAKGFAHRIERMQRPVLQANVFFRRNDLEFGGHQES